MAAARAKITEDKTESLISRLIDFHGGGNLRRFSKGEAIAFGVSLPEAQANAPLPPTISPSLTGCVD